MDIFNSELKNQKNEPETPAFFIKNTNFYWISETSLDSSVFYSLFDSEISQIYITEFELENKYELDSLGVIMLNKYEIELKNKFGLSNTVNSKYLQSILAFK